MVDLLIPSFVFFACLAVFAVVIVRFRPKIQIATAVFISIVPALVISWAVGEIFIAPFLFK